MSLLIKGMKLPKNCLLCPCHVHEGIGMGRYYYCQAIDDEPIVSEMYCPKDCPIVEIPTPHGRLIDADNLKCPLSWQGEIVKATVREAPTIIEAEGENNG